ncbi:hypothetical protein LEP1GSC061_0782 [Leptospira wolffii serovar Khorat str. Khorat-H2]|nr:hypothetical protein LEP1GSC061_0782 [Leptospira wolffii serovar Khorat str. Khorat-H2]
MYWRKVPHPIKESSENYIRIELPGELADGDERKKIETYWLWVWEEEIGEWMDRFILITPDRNLSQASLDLSEQAQFKSGCELQFRASGGKKRYEMKIGEYPPVGLRVHEIKEFELKPNQSLRIKMIYVSRPFSNPSSWVEARENARHKSLRLKYSIEDSALPNKMELCKF